MTIDTRFTETDRDLHGRPVPVETAQEARQGPLGRPILYVLLGGLALAAVYFIGTMIWSGSEDLPPAGQVQDQPATVAPPAVNLTPAEPAMTPAPAATAPALTLDPAPMAPAPVVVPAG